MTVLVFLSTRLHVSGEMYIYIGKFPFKNRIPKDRTVVDGPSAVRHEKRAHIDPATNAVSAVLIAFELQSFGTKPACDKALEKAIKKANSMFKKSIKKGQNF